MCCEFRRFPASWRTRPSQLCLDLFSICHPEPPNFHLLYRNLNGSGRHPENVSVILQGVYFSFAGAIRPHDDRMAAHVYNSLFGHHCRKWNSEKPQRGSMTSRFRGTKIRPCGNTVAGLRILPLWSDQALLCVLLLLPLRSGQVPPGGGRRVKSGSSRKADLTSVKDLVLGFWSHHLFPFVSRWRNSSVLIMSLVQVWRLWWGLWGGSGLPFPYTVPDSPVNSCNCTNWEDPGVFQTHLLSHCFIPKTSISLCHFTPFFFLPLSFFCSSPLHSVLCDLIFLKRGKRSTPVEL